MPDRPCRILTPEEVDHVNQQLQVILILAERWVAPTVKLLAQEVIDTLRAAKVTGGEMLADRPGWNIGRDLDPFAARPVVLGPLDGTVTGHAIRVVKP